LSVSTLWVYETTLCGWRRVLELGKWLGYERARRPRNWGLFPRAAWGFAFLYDYELQPVSCRMKAPDVLARKEWPEYHSLPSSYTVIPRHILVLCVTNLKDNCTSTLCFFFSLFFPLSIPTSILILPSRQCLLTNGKAKIYGRFADKSSGCDCVSLREEGRRFRRIVLRSEKNSFGAVLRWRWR